MTEFNPKNAEVILRTHCQTSGVRCKNRTPTTMWCALHMKLWLRPLAARNPCTPMRWMKRLLCLLISLPVLRRNTQLVILQEETGVTNVVDPLAGSYYIETLTDQLVKSALKLINEVEELGGMTKAVESGMPKLSIEKAAALRQARVDRGEEVIVGVNKFELTEEPDVDVLDIDNTAVRDSQIKKLDKIREERDNILCQNALDALTESASTGQGNLLDLAVNAARLRATVGEISYALEKEWGRHQAVTKTISGVYGSAYEGDEEFSNIQADKFSTIDGRRPRILVAKMGQDGHDRGAKVIATAFADIGFDVDIGPLFQTPKEAVNKR